MEGRYGKMQANVTKKKLEGASKARVPKRIGVVVQSGEAKQLFTNRVIGRNNRT